MLRILPPGGSTVSWRELRHFWYANSTAPFPKDNPKEAYKGFPSESLIRGSRLTVFITAEKQENFLSISG